jgi:hypothetical protein
MTRPSEWFRQPKNAWTWPLITLAALMLCVVGGVILALLFSGCASGRTVSDGGSVYDTFSVIMTDGTTVECVTNGNGLWCTP